MQTFLPFADFKQSAQCLDRQRLGKQRVECMQIARTLVGESAGWRNHPVVKMWQGHTSALFSYWQAIIDEWTSRGYIDNTRKELNRLIDDYGVKPLVKSPWLGNADFHLSHQSNLLRKDRAHYSKYFDGPDNLPYVWPAMESEGTDAN